MLRLKLRNSPPNSRMFRSQADQADGAKEKIFSLRSSGGVQKNAYYVGVPLLRDTWYTEIEEGLSTRFLGVNR